MPGLDDLAPAQIARRAAKMKQVLADEELPDYPDEMRETFKRLMEEHGLDTAKHLPKDA